MTTTTQHHLPKGQNIKNNLKKKVTTINSDNSSESSPNDQEVTKKKPNKINLAVSLQTLDLDVEEIKNKKRKSQRGTQWV